MAENTERSFFDAASDVAGNMLDTLASGGKAAHVLAAGLQAGINTEGFQARKQQRANAARLANLQVQQAEANLQRSMFNLEQDKINAPIETQHKQQVLENSRQSGRNLAQQFAQSQEAFPHRLAGDKANAQLNTLRAQQAQFSVWDKEEAQFRTKATDRLKQMVNYSQLNIAGQHIIDNSQAAKAFVDVTYLMQAAKDPAKLNYMVGKLSEDGWNIVPRKDGELQLDGMVDGKPMTFTANPAGLQKLTGMIQAQLKDDITAAKITGLDAANMGQATAKTILQNPIVKRVCGDDSAAYRVYSDFFNRKITDPKTGEIREAFSPEQKMYHTLNVSLGAALEDNKFNDAEKETLLPQVQQMIKTLGGELKIGDTVENTTVVWGRNQGYAQTYTIKDFLHTVLRDKDVISPMFGSHLQILAQKMKNNQLGGGNGGETTEAEKRLTDAELSRYTQSYGSAFAKLPPDIQANITAAENAVDNIAMDLGIVSAGPDGKYRRKADIPLNTLQAMADNEKDIFKKYSLEKVAQRGKWNLMYEKKKAELQKSEKEKSADKYRKEADAIRSAEKSSRKNVFTMGFGSPAMNRAASTLAVLEQRSRNKAESAKEKAASTEEKLKQKDK